MSTESPVEGLDQVTAILMGDQTEQEPQETEETVPPLDQEADPSAEATDEPDSESSADGEDQPEEGEPLTIKSLAEKLGTSAAKIYDSLELDLNGETITLGALKDHGKDLLQAKVLLAQAEEKQAETNTQVLERQRELQMLMQEQGIQPTDQDLQRQRDKWQGYVQEQNQLLAQYAPDYAEHESEFGDWLRKRGYSEAEMGGLVDARIRRDLFQSMQREQRIARALSAEEKPKQKPPKAMRKASKGAAQRAVEAFKQGKGSQEDAILALIAEGNS